MRLRCSPLSPTKLASRNNAKQHLGNSSLRWCFFNSASGSRWGCSDRPSRNSRIPRYGNSADLGPYGTRLFCVYDFSGGRTVDAQIHYYCHETSNFAREKLTNCNLGSGAAPVGKRMARKKAQRLRRQGECGLAFLGRSRLSTRSQSIAHVWHDFRSLAKV